MSEEMKKDIDLETGPEKEEEEKEPLLSQRSQSPRGGPRALRRQEQSYGGFIDDEDFDSGRPEETGCCGGRCAGCEKCCDEVSGKCSRCCTAIFGPCCEQVEKVQKKTGTDSARLHLNHNGKIYAYDHQILLSWRVMLGWTGTIFLQRAVYIIVPYVAFIAMASLVACYIGIPHARKLDTGRFNDFVNYIKVFIAFMLGLFLNNAFKRWWASVSYFKRFLVSIKQLLFTMHAIGINRELFAEVERLTITSSYILNEEVHCAQLSRKDHRAERWTKSLDRLVADGHLTKMERKELEDQSQCHTGSENTLGVMSTITWIWVAETMGQVKGNITPPLFVRLLFLCQDCLAQVELLKTNLTVQLPYTYVHMLCFMVHLINILLALSCGLTMGSALSEVQSRSQQIEEESDNSQYQSEESEYLMLLHVVHAVVGPNMKKHLGELYEAFQTLGVQFVMLLLQPLLYQSFLVIAHALCYPYGTGICHMPTETFIQQVHYEMQVMASGSSSHRKRLAKTMTIDGL